MPRRPACCRDRVENAALDAGPPFAAAFDETRTSVRTIFTRCFFPFTRVVLNVVSFFFVTVVESVTGRCRSDWTSTEPLASTVPLPGLYGVQSDVQR